MSKSNGRIIIAMVFTLASIQHAAAQESSKASALKPDATTAKEAPSAVRKSGKADAKAKAKPGTKVVNPSTPPRRMLPASGPARRQAIRAMPIQSRPNRMFHFYGNTVRRRMSRR